MPVEQPNALPKLGTASVAERPNVSVRNQKVDVNPKLDFLEEIRLKGGVQGAGLRPVDKNEGNNLPNQNPKDAGDGSLVHLLQGALAHIKNVNQSDSSDNDSASEWSEEDC